MKSKMDIIKKVDKQGRLVLPKKWREKHAGQNVILRIEEDKIVIEPYESTDLTKYFDSIEVDIESDLGDWKSVRRELFETR
ncbi:MAG: AbrB/MazE/SpoVT family DNA-binding domain-containing protein [Archaeoglobaceae archaeon]